VFYGVYAFVVVVAAGLVLLPNAPLVPILYLSQALNAILLVPLLVLIIGLSMNRNVMGDYAVGRTHGLVLWVITAVITLCVAALFWLTVF
jgi:Mn2+/Fe2+ NRAMP family transporter